MPDEQQPQVVPESPVVTAAVAEISNGTENLAENWAKLTEAEQAEVKQSMEYLGVTIRRTRKILKAYGGGKYLRRGIGAALSLSFEFNSMEAGDRMLRWCSRMVISNRRSKNPTGLSVQDRVQIVRTVPAIMEAMRRLAESSHNIAETFDLKEKPQTAPATVNVGVGVNINAMPPVAKIPPRKMNLLSERDRDV